MEAIITYPNKQEVKTLKAILTALNIKFEKKEVENTYSAEFISRVNEAKKQKENKELIKVDTRDIWKNIP
jgi:hypothetical protein